jgi:hypothetical protein
MWADPANINPSQTRESGNWDWSRAIPKKGIHNWDFPCSALVRDTDQDPLGSRSFHHRAKIGKQTSFIYSVLWLLYYFLPLYIDVIYNIYKSSLIINIPFTVYVSRSRSYVIPVLHKSIYYIWPTLTVHIVFIFCIKDIQGKKQNCIDKPNMLKDNDYFVHKTCSVDRPISFVLFVTVLISIYCTV